MSKMNPIVQHSLKVQGDLQIIEKFYNKFPNVFESALGISENDFKGMFDKLQHLADLAKQTEKKYLKEFIKSCVGKNIDIYENTYLRKGVLVDFDENDMAVTIRVLQQNYEIKCWYNESWEDFVNTDGIDYSLLWDYKKSPQFHDFVNNLK